MSRLEKGLFNITAGLVGLFFIVLVFNLLSFRPTLSANPKKLRQPSSVNAALTSLESSPPSSPSESALPCLDDGASYKMTSASKRFRVGARLCKTASEIRESLIVNKTNGFVATVFQLRSKEFTTDLIDLNPGENQIHISHELTDGKKIITELVVTF